MEQHLLLFGGLTARPKNLRLKTLLKTWLKQEPAALTSRAYVITQQRRKLLFHWGQQGRGFLDDTTRELSR